MHTVTLWLWEVFLKCFEERLSFVMASYKLTFPPAKVKGSSFSPPCQNLLFSSWKIKTSFIVCPGCHHPNGPVVAPVVAPVVSVSLDLWGVDIFSCFHFLCVSSLENLPFLFFDYVLDNFFFIWDKVLLCNSSWPKTLCIDQAVLKLREIHQSLPPRCLGF